MNIVAILHMTIGLCVIVISILSIVRTPRANRFFRIGICFPLESEHNLDDTRKYVSRLLLAWGLFILLLGVIGFYLPRQHWAVYAFLSSALILAGIGVLVDKAKKYSGRRSNKAL